MTRTRYIQDPVTYELIPAELYRREVSAGPTVIGDVRPYRSMVTGEMIEGRAQHREHLKRHGVVEVGNDLDNARPKAPEPPKGLKESLARVAYEKLRY